jgi:outer membrane lipoprotein-sorting protein
MNENRFDPGDEVLQSAFSAMRERVVPDGPSEMRIANTISALSAVAEQKPNIFTRMNNLKFITGMAASVLLVLGSIVLAVVMLRSPEVSFGEVVQAVRSAHSMSFVMTTQSMANKPPMKMKILITDQGQMYGESDDGGRMVMDTKVGHMLITEPITKTAIVMDLKNFPKESHTPADVMEGFKKLGGNSVKDLGRSEMDGRKTEKFSAVQDGSTFTIWANPKTREPIRIDVIVDAAGQNVTFSITDFEFNPAVPAGAFNTEVPKGYAVQNVTINLPDVSDGEHNVTEFLRGYAARNGGKFPNKIEDTSNQKILDKHSSTRPSEADMQWLIYSQMLKRFLAAVPDGKWKYLGTGKMNGDSHMLIFWYKSEKGYRGIFGDFSAKDLPSAPN